MIRCYDCGQPVPDHQIVRRKVRTGTSVGRRSIRDYYHKVSLCPACSAARDRAALVIVLALLGVGGLVFLTCIVGTVVSGLKSHSAEPAAATTYDLAGTISYADPLKREIGVNHEAAVGPIPAGNHRFSVAGDVAFPNGQPWPGVPLGGQVLCVLEIRNGQWIITKIKPKP